MRRAGKREGRKKRTTALEAGLKGAGGGSGGGGGGPWQADNRRERAELRRKEAGGGQTSRAFIRLHCQLPPVGVRCPRTPGKRLGRVHDQESLGLV